MWVPPCQTDSEHQRNMHWCCSALSNVNSTSFSSNDIRVGFSFLHIFLTRRSLDNNSVFGRTREKKIRKKKKNRLHLSAWWNRTVEDERKKKKLRHRAGCERTARKWNAEHVFHLFTYIFMSIPVCVWCVAHNSFEKQIHLIKMRYEPKICTRPL